ncbi:hypothetical protein FKV24_006115 [Lysobacter maris]|uniref:Uncharacterized protein n=1 Tax=Marilutibacter maris TaxID=1605891 RepID=A0A508ATS1_9GAMM|nr:hypothetical protein FKV24_006115 [Lysobacter maris]
MSPPPKPPRPAPDPPAGPELRRELVESYGEGPATDPFERWLALMEVVEVLCPRWPTREPRPHYGNMKL